MSSQTGTRMCLKRWSANVALHDQVAVRVAGHLARRTAVRASPPSAAASGPRRSRDRSDSARRSSRPDSRVVRDERVGGRKRLHAAQAGRRRRPATPARAHRRRCATARPTAGRHRTRCDLLAAFTGVVVLAGLRRPGRVRVRVERPVRQVDAFGRVGQRLRLAACSAPATGVRTSAESDRAPAIPRP